MKGGMRVGVVGCGLIGRKRAEALRPEDELIGCFDVATERAEQLAREFGGHPVASVADLLDLQPEVTVIATAHDALAASAELVLEGGSHVLLEKPAGVGTWEIDRLGTVAARTGRIVKVGFNHRFHPAIARAEREVRSGAHGELMYMRGRYGHGGRRGYEREWRADHRRSGGGELIDQGMHLIDLAHWIAGPLPLHSALLRTQFWDTAVEDNAVIVLGERESRSAPWAHFHVSWTEWKNTFSLEIYCRRVKLQIDGLARSYGPQTLTIYTMKPELGPPDVEVVAFPEGDLSWTREWAHLVAVIRGEQELLGSLADARYAWERVEEAYAAGPYATMREGVAG
jgi:predicted dehydrogenase